MKMILGQFYGRLKGVLFNQSESLKAFNIRLPRGSAWVLSLLRHYWMIIAGVAAALLAFWATQQYANERVSAERERMLPKGGFVEVLVAARSLAPGEKVSAETIAVRQVPLQWMFPNALRPHDFDSVNQTALSRPIEAGSPLTLDYLRQSRQAASNFSLDRGYRAISIPVDEVSSVGGLIKPGDRVDLWGTALSSVGGDTGQILQIQPEPTKAIRLAKLIAENLRVIATGQKTENSDSGQSEAMIAGYSNITLAVPAAVAAAVLGGQFQGRLGIALRSPADSVSLVSRRKTVRKTVELPVEILIGGVDSGGGLQ